LVYIPYLTILNYHLELVNMLPEQNNRPFPEDMEKDGRKNSKGQKGKNSKN